jgi:hypothetical protein
MKRSAIREHPSRIPLRSMRAMRHYALHGLNQRIEH